MKAKPARPARATSSTIAGGLPRTSPAASTSTWSIALRYLSRNGVQRLIDEGLVKVNGKITKASYRPRERRCVEMVAPPEPVNELVPEAIPLDIVYEDEHFLALNKQADLIVHPARGVWTGTLVNGLVHYGQVEQLNGNWRPGILHRLDRNTTGIMLVAKSDEAHWRTGAAVRESHDPEDLSGDRAWRAGAIGRRDRHADRQGPLRPREAGRAKSRGRETRGHEVSSSGSDFFRRR